MLTVHTSVVHFLTAPLVCYVAALDTSVVHFLRGYVAALDCVERSRKVSQCSKTDEGAEAYSAFTSVIRTLARKVDDDTLVDALCDVFGGAPLPARSF